MNKLSRYEAEAVERVCSDEAWRIIEEKILDPHEERIRAALAYKGTSWEDTLALRGELVMLARLRGERLTHDIRHAIQQEARNA